MNSRLIKYLLHFLSLFMVISPERLVAFTEPQIFVQVIQQTPIEAFPNEILSTQILVRNEHREPKTFRLNVLAPSNWTILQNPDFYFSLMPGEVIQQTLALKSGNIPEGPYHFTVQVIDINCIEKIGIDGFDVIVKPLKNPEQAEHDQKVLEELQVLPGELATFTSTIENNSPEIETYTINYTYPKEWKIVPETQESILVLPGKLKILPFAVQAPKTALAGTYTIKAHISDEKSTCTQQSFQVAVVENRQLLVTFEDSLFMCPSDAPYNIKSQCKNVGNTPIRIKLCIAVDPVSSCYYEEAIILIEPGEIYEYPIWIDPCGIPCEKKQFVFVNFLDDCDQSLFKQTIQVELLPRGIVCSDPYVRIPSHIRTFIAGQQGEWVAGGEFAGKGMIDPENERGVEFMFRYPTNSNSEIYDTFQVFYLGMWEPDWRIDLGDTIYELSPLTERWRYARGAGFYINNDKWDSGIFYAQGIFSKHDTPKELGYYLGYEPTNTFRLETNFLYKKCRHLPPSHIISQQVLADIFNQTTVQVEFARDFNSINKGDPFGFYGEWRGRIGKDTWYYIEKIYTGQDYCGYYTHFDQFSTGIDIGLCSRLRASFSTNQLKQNYKYKHRKCHETVPHQVQYNGQLNCGFNNGISTALTFLNLRAKDFGSRKEYDFDQYWGGFNFSYANERFSFLAITQIGLQKNFLNHKVMKDLQKYLIFGCWTFSEKFNANISYETGHTNYYEAKPWRHAFGVGINYFPKPQTWVQLYAQRNQQFVHAHSQNQFTARLRTVLSNKHAIGIAGQYFHNSKFKRLNEYLFLFEYIIPLNLPVNCRNDISDVAGCLYSEFDTPVSNAIVNLGGQRSLTDCNGAFSFQGITPGVYPLKTELLPKNMINSVQEPMPIELIGGKNNKICLNIVKGGKVSGTLILYDYLDSLGNVDHVINPDNPDQMILHEREPTSGFRITLDYNNGKEIYSCITSARGRFSFDGLRPGRWRVTVAEGEMAEYHYIERNDFYIDVKEGEEIKLPLRIMPEIRKIKSLE